MNISMKLIEMLIDAFVPFFPFLNRFKRFLRNYFWPEAVKRRRGSYNFFVFEKLTRALTPNCTRNHFVTYTEGKFLIASRLYGTLLNG